MSFSETFLISEQEKVGWMHGLIWKRRSAIEYKDYMTEWSGQANRSAVFRPLLAYLLMDVGLSRRQGNSLSTSASKRINSYVMY